VVSATLVYAKALDVFLSVRKSTIEEIFTFSLHDALPIYYSGSQVTISRHWIMANSSFIYAQRPSLHSGIGDNGARIPARRSTERSEEHTSELQSRENLVCRLLLEKKK